jgi:hypothetical protein
VNDFQKTLEKETSEKKTILNQKDQLEREMEKIKMEGLIK